MTVLEVLALADLRLFKKKELAVDLWVRDLLICTYISMMAFGASS